MERFREETGKRNPEVLPNCPEIESQPDRLSRSLAASEFDGYTQDEIDWIIAYSEVMAAPTRNVSIVKFEENGSENESWLGSVNYKSGALTLYQLATRSEHPDEVIASTLDHEWVGHENDPFNENSYALFGSREAREEAKMHAYNVAQQTDITGIGLNVYHQSLLESFRSGNISVGRFLRETHAIMAEMRINDPETLRKVEENQAEIFALKAEQEEKTLKEIGFTRILTEEGSEEAAGIDKTLTAILNVNSLDGLNQRIAERNQFLKEHPSPFNKDTNK